jgi:hypothetical protein
MLNAMERLRCLRVMFGRLGVSQLVQMPRIEMKELPDALR